MDAEAVPAISVVIAARNAADFIADTLDSLRRQSFPAFEVVVVDDGSSDATAGIVGEVASTDRRFHLVPGAARGVSAARNLGLARVRAPLLLFLDADDLLEADALRRFVVALDESDRVAALGGIRRISETGEPVSTNDTRALAPARDTLTALLKKNFIVNGGAIVMRTEVARDCGGYDETLSHGEDWEFWCRLAERGDFVTVEGPPLLCYRLRASGANYLRRGPAFARSVACIDKLAQRQSLRDRYGGRLSRLLRARRIDVFWSGVRNEMQFGDRGRALAIAAGGLILYPDSILRPKLALRLLRTMSG